MVMAIKLPIYLEWSAFKQFIFLAPCKNPNRLLGIDVSDDIC